MAFAEIEYLDLDAKVLVDQAVLQLTTAGQVPTAGTIVKEIINQYPRISLDMTAIVAETREFLRKSS